MSRENTDVTDKNSNINEKRPAPMNILQTLKKSGTDGIASGRKKQDRDTKTPESGSNNSRINAINNERVDSPGNSRKQEQVVVKETEPKTARKSLALTRTARISNDTKTTKQINDDNHKTANGGRGNPTDLAFATADGNEKDKKTANGDAPRSKPSRTIPGVTGKNNSRILKDQPTAKDPEELKEMAEALLARAVMRRVAAIKDPHDKQQNTATDVSGAQMPGTGPGPIKGRSAHKTHSMQSLAVPGSGLGARDNDGNGDGADRVSLGSRRDSVRQSMDSVSCKSVDYRLQNSQSVVVGAANGGSGEEKGKSVLMHDSSLIRSAIPALPLSLALFCLISNVLLPGLGESFD
ncbi:hypothetical protein C0Q70_13671 [Pomacea canaliculata]|uniref:Uncharacterized protein n=1 Tax=Pomacea canaliculata TaxID=400727 RepID=A0A2T7NXY6_POMCA|nr:hypothetical protein C0Q70_13671 [Pomacea canaliculata]